MQSEDKDSEFFDESVDFDEYENVAVPPQSHRFAPNLSDIREDHSVATRRSVRNSAPVDVLEEYGDAIPGNFCNLNITKDDDVSPSPLTSESPGKIATSSLLSRELRGAGSSVFTTPPLPLAGRTPLLSATPLLSRELQAVGSTVAEANFSKANLIGVTASLSPIAGRTPLPSTTLPPSPKARAVGPTVPATPSLLPVVRAVLSPISTTQSAPVPTTLTPTSSMPRMIVPRMSVADQRFMYDSPPVSGRSALLNQMSVFTQRASDSPTFVLDCTSKCRMAHGLVADKPLLYFGFRPLDVNSEDVIGFINKTDFDVTISCRVWPTTATAYFQVPRGSIRIRPGVKYDVHVIFRPNQTSRFRAYLRIACLLSDGSNLDYNIDLLGMGGTAVVRPQSLDALKRELRISSTGHFKYFPRSLKKFDIAFTNLGKRDAFVYIILQDTNSEELPSENAIASPNCFVLPKGGSQKVVNVMVFVQSAGGSESSFSLRSHQQQSGASSKNLSSRPSSAMDSSNTGGANVAFRILAMWGEERQRQRINMVDRNKTSRLKILNRYFTWQFSGENPQFQTSHDSLLSSEDYRIFKGCMRYTIIEIIDKRSRIQYTSTRFDLLSIGNGNTIIELEPDNTLKAAGDTTVFSSHH